MIYSTDTKNARMLATRDKYNGGSLRVVDASSTPLAAVTLDATSGAVVADVLALSGFPKVATASSSGTAASCDVLTSSGATAASGLTVGVPGSGAEVIIDNGVGSLTITIGSSVTFLASPSFQHAP